MDLPRGDPECYHTDWPEKIYAHCFKHSMAIKGAITTFQRREFMSDPVNLVKIPKLGKYWAQRG